MSQQENATWQYLLYTITYVLDKVNEDKIKLIHDKKPRKDIN